MERDKPSSRPANAGAGRDPLLRLGWHAAKRQIPQVLAITLFVLAAYVIDTARVASVATTDRHWPYRGIAEGHAAPERLEPPPGGLGLRRLEVSVGISIWVGVKAR